MAIKREVAIGIARGLGHFWKCEEFRDYTVKVDNVEFGCHQLILAACSDFFKCLFRSKMLEMERKCVTIYSISSEIFELLLETMYTCHDVLTNANVIDIWRAAHQLQIHFMISECENFAIKTLTLDNYILYLQTCKALNSTTALDRVWTFVQKNCNHFFETSYFLQIPFTDIENLIKSKNLATKSEDEVIHAIVKWSEFSFLEVSQNDKEGNTNEKIEAIFEKEVEIHKNDGMDDIEPCTKKSKIIYTHDNNEMTREENELNKSIKTNLNEERLYREDMNAKDERCKYIALLLSNARTYIVSQECLKMLANHTLVIDNKQAKDIIIEALFYQLQVNKRNGYWPLKAIHRKNSKFKYCLINATDTRIFQFYIFARKKWFELPNKGLLDIKGLKLAATDKKLYAIGTKIDKKFNSVLSFSLFKTKIWSEINVTLELNSNNFLVTVIGSLMYVVLPDKKKMWKLDTDLNELTEMSSLNETIDICHVMPYEQYILAFHSSNNETMVQCFDTSNNTWTPLNNLEGPANKMTSVIDEHLTYLLQSNGNLWKVVKTQSKVIDFEFVVKLWNCKCSLNGAAIFMNELYLNGTSKSDDIHSDVTVLKSLPGVFSKIYYFQWETEITSISIPFLLETDIGDQ